MLVLITYDVNTEDAVGRKRLRQIAKQCANYGQRVQNSVFECLLDTAQCRSLQNKLCKIMDVLSQNRVQVLAIQQNSSRKGNTARFPPCGLKHRSGT